MQVIDIMALMAVKAKMDILNVMAIMPVMDKIAISPFLTSLDSLKGMEP